MHTDERTGATVTAVGFPRDDHMPSYRATGMQLYMQWKGNTGDWFIMAERDRQKWEEFAIWFGSIPVPTEPHQTLVTELVDERIYTTGRQKVPLSPQQMSILGRPTQPDEITFAGEQRSDVEIAQEADAYKGKHAAEDIVIKTALEAAQEAQTTDLIALIDDFATKFKEALVPKGIIMASDPESDALLHV